MSAIAAIINWDGRPVEPAVLSAMNRCVQHRCPDGAWVWANGSAGMAQADLATLPEDQPGVALEYGSLHIAASCRLDNRDDLLRALPSGMVTAMAPDAALILAAYRAWGEACVARLIGNFAFAIWDSAARRLFAARDSSGARQLFYYRDRSRLIVASDRTQIFQDPSVRFEIDEDQLLEYLAPTYQFGTGWDLGLFRNVHVLPAGHCLKVEENSFVVRRFWHWRDRAADVRNEPELIEAYLHTLEQAIQSSLRSRKQPIALELSGGLDSTAVAALTSRLSTGTGRKLHTLSLVFDTIAEADERQRISRVLERYPLSPHFLAADDLMAPQGLAPDWTPTSVGGPNELLLPISARMLHDQAIQAGCQVVLTGMMGDSLNDGSDRVYFDLLRRGHWAEAIRRIIKAWRHSRRTALGALAYYGLLPFAPMPLLRASLAALDSSQGVPCEIPAYIAPNLRRQLIEVDRAIRLRYVSSTQTRCPSARYTLEEIEVPIVSCTAPVPQPIERRHPYTDQRLVEMVLAMPADLKWERDHDIQQGRYHHRVAMAGILPNEVRINNPGVDFGPALRRSLSPTVVSQWLADSPVIHIFERGYVRRNRFLEFIARQGGAHFYVQALLGLEAWLRALAPGGAMHQLIPRRAVA